MLKFFKWSFSKNIFGDFGITQYYSDKDFLLNDNDFIKIS